MTTKSMSVSTSLQHPWFGNRNDYEILQQLLHTKMAGLLDGEFVMLTATIAKLCSLECSLVAKISY